MIDIIEMGHGQNTQRDVLDHGFVRLVDMMPRLADAHPGTGDAAIVQAARVSYQKGTKKVDDDAGLIRYLLRHKHTTPFEMVEFKFHMAMPIFVARQFIRHRTANVNEISARYSVLPDRFYIPEPVNVQAQATENKQGRSGELTPALIADLRDWLASDVNGVHTDYAEYTRFLESGVARELARCGLPLNIYTEWYWKCDLHNIFNFLRLRLDSHAQMEIQVYAQAMADLIRPLVPIAYGAFEDYILGSVTLTRLEAETLRRHLGALNLHYRNYNGRNPEIADIESTNKREKEEWKAKARTLGL